MVQHRPPVGRLARKSRCVCGGGGVERVFVERLFGWGVRRLGCSKVGCVLVGDLVLC